MYLVYQPEGSDEPQRFEYVPQRLRATERELLERRTDRHFAQFTKDVIAGNSLCRRALLWLFLKREHPRVKFDDVDFAWDELKLEYSRSEYLKMREDAQARPDLTPDQLAALLEKLDEELESAYDDGADVGKAQRPVVD